jgi:4'-phosphopantetheinyl transferase EntD
MRSPFHPSGEALTDVFSRLCGSARVRVAWIDEVAAAPQCDEMAHVADASDVRRREFAAGRSLLRVLVPDVGPIRVGPWREPVWPADGYCSLTHDRDLVAAAVSAVPIGIDLERWDAVGPELIDVIATHRDQIGDDGVNRTLALSAKESVIKCARRSRWVDLHELVLTDVHAPLNEQPGTAVVGFDDRQWSVRWTLHAERVWTVVVA